MTTAGVLGREAGNLLCIVVFGLYSPFHQPFGYPLSHHRMCTCPERGIAGGFCLPLRPFIVCDRSTPLLENPRSVVCKNLKV